MTVMYTAREVAEAAVEKEQKRRDFYARVTALSTNPDMKEFFQWLTEEEDRHVASFTDVRDVLPVDAKPEEYTADMEAYMDSVIDDRLYSEIDSEEFVRRAVSTNEVFRMAVGFERDAIHYFREFLPHLSESDKRIVLGLIEEEKGHIRKLVEVMHKLGV